MRKKGENNIRCAGKIAIRLNENNDFKPDESQIFSATGPFLAH
jgi:hypothetical protein